MEINLSPLIEFLVSVGAPTLGCGMDELTKFLTNKQLSYGKLSSFVTDNNIQCLQLSRKPGEMVDDIQQYLIFLELDVTHHGNDAASIVVNKSPNFNILEENSTTELIPNPASQLLVITLGLHNNATTPLQNIHNYLQNTLQPLLNTLPSSPNPSSPLPSIEDDSRSSEARMKFQNIQKKLSDLLVALSQCENNTVYIPSIPLLIDPEIQRVFDLHKQDQHKVTIDDFQDKLQDPLFLNTLHSSVLTWIKDIQAFTKNYRDHHFDTVPNEILYWKSLEKVLLSTLTSLSSPQVEITFQILKFHKKFMASISFETDTGLKAFHEQVQSILILIRELPIEDLLSSTSIAQCIKAIKAFFIHMRKIKACPAYPIARSFLLLESLSKDLKNQIMKILANHKLLYMDYDQFLHVTNNAKDLLQIWDSEMRTYRDMVRELLRKRQSAERVPSKIVAHHQALLERIEDIRIFRSQHQSLIQVISKVLYGNKNKKSTTDYILREISIAYKLFASIDVLDCAWRNNSEEFDEGIKLYNERIDKAESVLASYLREELSGVSTSLGMFDIFSRYNSLFTRPRIMTTIREYQTVLIREVKEDILYLQQVFKKGYFGSNASRFAALRDVPFVSGHVLWMYQLENRLKIFLQRIDDVLGKGWKNAEGQMLRSEGDVLLEKLSSKNLFDDWVKTMKENTKILTTNTSNKLFQVQQKIDQNGEIGYSLQVNIDNGVLGIYRIYNVLSSLNYRIPFSIKIASEEIKNIYPFVFSLDESLRTFALSLSMIHGESKYLVYNKQKEIYDIIYNGIMYVTYDNINTLELYSRQLSTVVFSFFDMVVLLNQKIKYVDYLLWLLSDTRYLEKENVFAVILKGTMQQFFNDEYMYMSEGRSTFQEGEDDTEGNIYNLRNIVAEIQGLMNELILSNYHCIQDYVRDVNTKVEMVLKEKTIDYMHVWLEQRKEKGDLLITYEKETTEERFGGADKETQKRYRRDEKDLSKEKGGDNKKKNKYFHLKLLYNNEDIYPSSNINSIKQHMIGHLHGNLFNLLNIEKIDDVATSNSPDSMLEASSPSHHITSTLHSTNTYLSLIETIPSKHYEALLKEIDAMMLEVSQYIGIWMEYNVLWDCSREKLCQKMSFNTDTWQAFLSILRQDKANIINNTDVIKKKLFFNLVVIDYDDVIKIASQKINNFVKELLTQQSQRLFEYISQYYQHIQNLRYNMESNRFLEGTLVDVMKYIETISECQKYQAEAKEYLITLMYFHKIFEKYHIPLSNTWIYPERLQSEIESMNEIFVRKNSLLEKEMPSIKSQLLKFERTIEAKYKNLISDWLKEKPEKNIDQPSAALDTVLLYEMRASRLMEEKKVLHQAKSIIATSYTTSGNASVNTSSTSDDPMLLTLLEEIQNMKFIWENINEITKELDLIKMTVLKNYNIGNVKKILYEINNKLQGLPSKFHQYNIYDEIIKNLILYEKKLTIMNDIVNNQLYIKPRHIQVLSSIWSAVSNAPGAINDNTGVNVSMGALAGSNSTIYDYTIDYLIGNMNEEIEKEIRNVIVLANNEYYVEETLLNIKNHWTQKEIAYTGNSAAGGPSTANRIRSIKNMEEALAMIQEHQNTLHNIKSLPYSSIFDEEISAWKTKIEKLFLLISTIADIQKKWKYLYNIFLGASSATNASGVKNDIEQLLPMEYQKFINIDNEYYINIKKLYLKNRYIDILSLDEKALEKINDQLYKIQKSIMEYLEIQRNKYPKFFFIGDEDLLDIISNSRYPSIIQMYVKKLFSGIHSLCLTNTKPSVNALEDGAVAVGSESGADDISKNFIYGIKSEKGETILFDTDDVIDVYEYSSSYLWLERIDRATKNSLKILIQRALVHYVLGIILPVLSTEKTASNDNNLTEWILHYPLQVILVCIRLMNTALIDMCFYKKYGFNEKEKIKVENITLSTLEDSYLHSLSLISQFVVENDRMKKSQRQKLEIVVTELIYYRDTIRQLKMEESGNNNKFLWEKLLKFYLCSNENNIRMNAMDIIAYAKSCIGESAIKVPLMTPSALPTLLCPLPNIKKEHTLSMKIDCVIGNSSLEYGYEYHGNIDLFIETGLTSNCYLTMCHALENRYGGSPFGPAGTGKTETVKSLAYKLGRHILTFCCDESFDIKAISRILSGVCQVGCWICFDEFNRLEEQILSSASELILSIQSVLKQGADQVALMNHKINLSPYVGIFITMNPMYIARSILPYNMKLLFRDFSMNRPDQLLITQVMLFSQGFNYAEKISNHIVDLFAVANQQFSKQAHYDFSLRTLKSVLTIAGEYKRGTLISQTVKAMDDPMVHQELAKEQKESTDDGRRMYMMEQNILAMAIWKTLSPRLNYNDMQVLKNLLLSSFPNNSIINDNQDKDIRGKIIETCEKYFIDSSNEQAIEKIIQLYFTQKFCHGVILYGKSGVGKSTTWKILFETLGNCEKFIISPKSLKKEELFGNLDSNTLEWTDGVFTEIIRNIIHETHNSQSQKSPKNYWIVFDGDIDPEWVENLNSVLDDNKILTLANGERLALPPSVRIIFEVDSLQYATMATVSRCGLIWFADNILTHQNYTRHFLRCLRYDSRPGVIEKETAHNNAKMKGGVDGVDSVAVAFVESINEYFQSGGVVEESLLLSLTYEHVMPVSMPLLLGNLFVFIRRGIAMMREREIQENNHDEDVFIASCDKNKILKFAQKWILFSIMWVFGGSLDLGQRYDFVEKIVKIGTNNYIPLPVNLSNESSLLDFYVNERDGEWSLWRNQLYSNALKSATVTANQEIIPTIDTLRHVFLMNVLLQEKRLMLLSGPPGGGKSLTTLYFLRQALNTSVVFLNFSAGTTISTIMKIFDDNCEYVKTANGVVLRPLNNSKRLVIFCDEINLPVADAFGTQRVITFMREIIETGKFWKINVNGRSRISLENIYFAAASNPPKDFGRTALSNRFLRHSNVIYVDHPNKESMITIYSVKLASVFQEIETISTFTIAVTMTLVEIYEECKHYFMKKENSQQHYVFSPRELSRWVNSLTSTLSILSAHSSSNITVDKLGQIILFEGMRTLADRLISSEQRLWVKDCIQRCILKNNSSISSNALSNDVYFIRTSDNTIKEMSDLTEYQTYLSQRLSSFNSEMVQASLVFHNDAVNHIVRILRVLNTEGEHMLLLGDASTGKTSLARYAAWLNNMSLYQLSPGLNYSMENFEADLRTVLKRAGVRGEKICFIFDESNILETAFLERINSLLASGEVPGLFEGEEKKQLLSEIRQQNSELGSSMDDHEAYMHFSSIIRKNLHIVFTLSYSGLSSRITLSPALFSRCVIDFFDSWDSQDLLATALHFIQSLNVTPLIIDNNNEKEVTDNSSAHMISAENERIALALVRLIYCTIDTCNNLGSRTKQKVFNSREYIALVMEFCKLYKEKSTSVMQQYNHLHGGQMKLKETESSINDLRTILISKEKELKEKSLAAENKMKAIIVDQSNVEEKKKKTEELAIRLNEQVKEIEVRSQAVRTQMETIEPMIEQAKSNVSNIQKRALDELRVLNNPPPSVRFAMETVIVLLQNLSISPSWDDIKKEMKSQDFINQILNFNSQNISSKTLAFLDKNYLSTSEWDCERIMRASKAAGPLAYWVESQIKFGELLRAIEPLQKEIQSLEIEKGMSEQQLNEAKELASTLEEKLSSFKKEYAELIGKMETIKSEMNQINEKIERSHTLLKELGSEGTRWNDMAENLKQQSQTIIGDCLFASTSLIFSGAYDVRDRGILMDAWSETLAGLNIATYQSFNAVEYLSTANERLLFSSYGVSNDDSSMLNAIIMSRSSRYGLVIDPSNNAYDYLKKMLGGKNLMEANCFDKNFLKTFENALRFGYSLLVQGFDEKILPSIIYVLNKEIIKRSARTVVTLNDKETEFNSSFNLFFVTSSISNDMLEMLSSKVTIINFSTTKASLENQILMTILKVEKPEIEKQRSRTLSVQAELAAKIQGLENDMLANLADSTGNILENSSLIMSLQDLKKQAKIVRQEAEKADEILKTLEATSKIYSPFAETIVAVYFLVEKLTQINPVYVSSISSFLEIVNEVLQASKTGEKEHESTRLLEMFHAFFKKIFLYYSRGISNNDRYPFGLALVCVKLQSTFPISLGTNMYDSLLDDVKCFLQAFRQKKDELNINQIGKERWNSKESFELVMKGNGNRGAFMEGVGESMKGQIEDWKLVMDVETPELVIEKNSAIDALFSKKKEKRLLQLLMLFTELRMDRMVSITQSIIENILLVAFIDTDTVDVRNVMNTECDHITPLLFLVAPGVDISSRIMQFVQPLGNENKMFSFALGSDVVDEEAIGVISKYSNGNNHVTVVLKNVHVSVKLLETLEKILSRTTNTNLRVVMVAEMQSNSILPVNLVRRCVRIVLDSPIGVVANIRNMFNSTLTSSVCEQLPIERTRLYFLAALLHVTCIERSRYAPLGWSTPYKFLDADFTCTIDVIDKAINEVCSSKDAISNINVDMLNWNRMRGLLQDSIYGGKLTSVQDQIILAKLVENIFNAKNFDDNCVLCPVEAEEDKEKAFYGPIGVRKRDQFIQWLDSINAKETALWIGLPSNSEAIVRTKMAYDVLTKLVGISSDFVL